MAILDHALDMSRGGPAPGPIGIQLNGAAPILSPSIVDLGAAGDGIPNNPLWYVRVAEGVTGPGGTTVTFDLLTSDEYNDGGDVLVDPVVLVSSGAIPVGNLTAGAIPVELPIPRKGLKRYLQVQITPSAALAGGMVESIIGY